MSAQAGFRWLYASVTRDLDEVRRLRVDAALELPGAAEALRKHHQAGHDLLMQMGEMA
jgi:hypothetical protein